ncbi:type 1 fimbrial protein (plasmid) [Escherichia albertii]|uniref:fimbrial protein n=1 Tax=Escherichia albertii TaxID=208962 RepID=UPI001957B330|nr:fimbrial protein [Escherichia albertii]QST30934.1 type 1 fimbrial protein [Escherichia albertii]QST40247.1 type 1 fimbrial protein [Escherichia albertii]
MNLTKYLLATAITAALGSTAVQAADGTITFNGTVTNSACTAIASVTANSTVTGSTPLNATLTLPAVTADTLNAATGTYAGHTPFSIELTGCQVVAGLNNVRTLFTTASSPAGQPGVMANTATTSPAANVAVAILPQSGTTQIDLNNGTNRDPGQALPAAAPAGTAGPVTLRYRAAYKSLSTGVTAGNVTGVADFVISYF